MKKVNLQLVEEINRHPEGIRTKVNKDQSRRVFLKGLLRYPFSTFNRASKKKYSPQATDSSTPKPLFWW